MVTNRNITYLIILFALMCIPGYSQSDKEPCKYWTAGLSAALTNYDAWEIEPSIAYHPIRYAGIGVGILYTKTMGKPSYSGYTADQSLIWFIASDDLNYVLALRPELRLATPAVYLDKDQELALSLRVSPGLTIPFPANLPHNVEYIPNRVGVNTAVAYDRVTNTGAKACYYHLKTAIALEMDEITLSLGYNFSNFDLYGGSRNIIVEGKRLKPATGIKYMHSVSVGVSYSF